EDGYAVVWWDPHPESGLQLGVKPLFGVRREELIVKDVARHVVAAGRTRYDSWRLARIDARDAGSRPSLVVETAREWAGRDAGGASLAVDAQDISVVDVASRGEATRERSGGLAFGVLVHAVLARAPFDASRAVLDEIAASEARVFGMTDEEA